MDIKIARKPSNRWKIYLKLSIKLTGFLFIGLLLAGAGYLAWWLWMLLDRPNGPITGIFPVDEDHAVIIRKSKESGSYLFFVDRLKGNQWRAWIPYYYRYSKTISTVNGFLTVRTYDKDGTIETMAFSLKDGNLSWEGGDSDLPGGSSDPAGKATLSSKGKVFEFYREKEKGTFVLAIDMSTGKTLWKTTVDNNPNFRNFLRNWLEDNYLTVQGKSGIKILDQETGNIVKEITGYYLYPAIVKNIIVYIHNDKLHVFSINSLSDRVSDINLISHGDNDVSVWLSGRGGNYKKDIIVSDNYYHREEAELLCIDSNNYKLRWRLSLGQGRIEPVTDVTVQEDASLVSMSGDLSRFMPVKIADYKSGGYRLGLVDLERPEISWMTPLRKENFLTSYWISHGGNYYLWIRSLRILALFNGNNGKLEHAVRFDSNWWTESNGLSPYYFYGNHIWGYTDNQWVVFDATTLQPLSWSGKPVRVDDAGMEVKELLGIKK